MEECAEACPQAADRAVRNMSPPLRGGAGGRAGPVAGEGLWPDETGPTTGRRRGARQCAARGQRDSAALEVRAP